MKTVKVNWIDLSPYWDEILELAEQREKQKKRYKSTKNWSKYSTHFLGLLGETVYSIVSGIPVDTKLRKCGDKGYDFLFNEKTVSVKTTVYWQEPHLKEYPNPKHWSDYYVLIGLDIKRKRGKICGWCKGSELRQSELIDYGYGPQRVMKFSTAPLAGETGTS